MSYIHQLLKIPIFLFPLTFYFSINLILMETIHWSNFPFFFPFLNTCLELNNGSCWSLDKDGHE